MPENEDYMPPEARIEQINNLELRPSWAKGAVVKIKIEKSGEGFTVDTAVDPKPDNWLDIAPTAMEFGTADETAKYAEKLRDNVEKWPEGENW